MILNLIAIKCLGDVEVPRYLNAKTDNGTAGLAPSIEGFPGTRWEGNPPPLPVIPPPPPGTPDPIGIPPTIPIPVPDPPDPPPGHRPGDPGNPLNPGPAPP